MYIRAVQLIASDSHAHLVSKAGSVIMHIYIYIYTVYIYMQNVIVHV